MQNNFNIKIIIDLFIISMDTDDIDNNTSENSQKKPKRGIIYLSTIPPYMNVTKIREIFGQYGEIGRVYMALAETGIS